MKRVKTFKYGDETMVVILHDPVEVDDGCFLVDIASVKTDPEGVTYLDPADGDMDIDCALHALQAIATELLEVRVQIGNG